MASSGSSGAAPGHGNRAGSSSVGTFDAAAPAPTIAGRHAAAFRPSDQRVDWVRGAVARYERPLTQYAMHILGGDLDRARDLVQEAFLRLCDQDQQYLDSHLAEWLYTVCRNLAIDTKRKDRRMRPMSDEQRASFAAAYESPTDAAERVDSYGRVVDAMQDLPARQQEIVRLKFQAGMSYKQIGDVMNLTATNVGFILHTAIKSLRERLGNDSDNPVMSHGSEGESPG
jgi:RNA polymerase sigma factor (sigma-70 family)